MASLRAKADGRVCVFFVGEWLHNMGVKEGRQGGVFLVGISGSPGLEHTSSSPGGKDLCKQSLCIHVISSVADATGIPSLRGAI